MAEAKDILEKNVAMWETMTGSYMDYASQAFETTVAQSTGFQKQVRDVVNGVVGAQFEAALTGLRMMERQVEALSSLTSQVVEETK